MSKERTIFKEYYTEHDFQDKYLENKEEAIDIIIPVLNTNELWKNNLMSIYREVPINRLLIGDGGCTDDTVEIAKSFPRCEIVFLPDTSLGYRIRKLIENVQTSYFAYFHSDVYLPKGWFESVYKYRNTYEWLETNRVNTVLIDYISGTKDNFRRPLSGSQFGQTDFMKKVSTVIDDDYSYRQEDIIFAELVEEAGGKYRRISDTFHYHQLMNKPGAEVPQADEVEIKIKRKPNIDFEVMMFETQVKGFIKYLKPEKKYIIDSANIALFYYKKTGHLDWDKFEIWVKETNPVWLKYLKKNGPIKERLKLFILNSYRKIKKFI